MLEIVDWTRSRIDTAPVRRLETQFVKNVHQGLVYFSKNTVKL